MYANASSANQGQSAVSVRSESEVESELKRLDRSCEQLFASLSHLSERLSPVLMSAPPASDGRTAPEPVMGSQLGQSLRSAALRTEDMAEAVSRLIGRLCL